MSQADIVYEFFKRGRKLTESAVSGWERGQVPNIDHVDLLAQVYAVTTEKILNVMYEMSRARQESSAAK